jgi:hypothetical protein
MTEQCNTGLHIRRAIEHYVLQIYEVDGETLKAPEAWPGYYTLQSGTKVPCVYLVGEKLVPKDWKPSGVECLIQDVPQEEKLRSRGAGIFVETWDVTFTNYGAVEATEMPGNLFTISRRMGDLFAACNLRHKHRSTLSCEQLTARIRATSIRPPLP